MNLFDTVLRYEMDNLDRIRRETRAQQELDRKLASDKESRAQDWAQKEIDRKFKASESAKDRAVQIASMEGQLAAKEGKGMPKWHPEPEQREAAGLAYRGAGIAGAEGEREFQRQLLKTLAPVEHKVAQQREAAGQRHELGLEELGLGKRRLKMQERQNEWLRKHGLGKGKTKSAAALKMEPLEIHRTQVIETIEDEIKMLSEIASSMRDVIHPADKARVAEERAAARDALRELGVLKMRAGYATEEELLKIQEEFEAGASTTGNSVDYTPGDEPDLQGALEREGKR